MAQCLSLSPTPPTERFPLWSLLFSWMKPTEKRIFRISPHLCASSCLYNRESRTPFRCVWEKCLRWWCPLATGLTLWWENGPPQAVQATCHVECSCTHLTDFAAVLPVGHPVPLQRFIDLTVDNISLYPHGMFAVGVVVIVFIVLVMFSIQNDIQAQRHDEELKMKKLEKWKQAETNFWHLSPWRRMRKQFKGDLQRRHTWASLFFRKSGLSSISFWC